MTSESLITLRFFFSLRDLFLGTFFIVCNFSEESEGNVKMHLTPIALFMPVVFNGSMK